VARPGDILLVVGTADDSRDVLRRAEAWGLTRVWLGAGPPPPPGLAEHVVWHHTPAPAVAARSGDVVLLYHLLWELTHVVFEHPGLLLPPPECDGPTCITCSDQATVAEIRAVDAGGLAEVVAAGRPETVDVSLVDGAAAGDLVLVHAGVAVAVLEEP
ncbi:MAG: HypC/HybG/HupF family hydrogenase formation chaperone, partial [Acidimicrobiales bacterium]